MDHSTIDYAPFRKSFYIEVPEIKRMSDEEVEKLRESMDGIKARDPRPRPLPIPLPETPQTLPVIPSPPFGDHLSCMHWSDLTA